MAPEFSVIVPVYNRRGEVDELLASLSAQTFKDFEVILVEDGSTDPCGDIAEKYASQGLPVRYFFKDNEGRSIARNYGMERAEGRWLVFFDSDCIIPAEYFAYMHGWLQEHPQVDCYGGPDAAHQSFSPVQKAINYAMTSFLTTGGIRGGRSINPDKFVPRTFNMGFRREVFDRVGGFREMFSEDIDMSTRIRTAGFRTTLVPNAPVWHKRRIDLRKFFRQVHVFGMSRITLHELYPGSMKPVHALPAIATVIGAALLLLGIFASPWWLMPLGIYALLIFADAWRRTRSPRIALLAVPASAIQIIGYGSGFLRAFTRNILLGRGRDPEQEIRMRKGK